MNRDFQKLIFYYYADHYINFKDLITELYRIYKTRIWLSAINPASFSQHALGQPPSGIGPGAVGGFNQQLNNTYTMMYGPDPDPYGAIPPYRIGYETYTPNYPGIPGVANSFAPTAAMAGGYEPYGGDSGDATPSMAPGVTPTGTPADYNYYYDRNTSAEQTPKAYSPFPSATAPTNPYYPTMYGGLQTAMPSMGGNERSGGLGFGLTPPFNLSQGMGNMSLSQDFGRSRQQANLPAPIGTRPGSNGNNTAPAPTSNPMQDPTRQYNARLPTEFVPGQQQVPPQMPASFLQSTRGGMTQTPGDSPHRGNWARLSGEAGKEQVMQSYLEGLQGKEHEDTRADEMSRER